MICDGCMLPIAYNEGVTYFLVVNEKMTEYCYHNRFDGDCLGQNLTELHRLHPVEAATQADGVA